MYSLVGKFLLRILLTKYLFEYQEFIVSQLLMCSDFRQQKPQ